MLLPLSSVLFHSEKWNIAVWSDEVRKFNHIQLKRLLIRISIWLANNVLAIDFTNLHPVSNCRCARKLSKYSLKSPLLEHGNTRWCRVVAVVTKYYDRRIEWPLFLQENFNLEGGGGTARFPWFSACVGWKSVCDIFDIAQTYGNSVPPPPLVKFSEKSGHFILR